MNFEKGSSADANGDSDSSENGTSAAINDETFNQGYASDPNLDVGSGTVDSFSQGIYSDPNTHHMNPNFQFSPGFVSQGFDSAYGSRGSTVAFQHQAAEVNYKPSLRSSVGSESGFRSDTPAEELHEHLGDLKINVDSVGKRSKAPSLKFLAINLFQHHILQIKVEIWQTLQRWKILKYLCQTSVVLI